jgi:small subunit ribosomal protein S21
VAKVSNKKNLEEVIINLLLRSQKNSTKRRYIHFMLIIDSKDCENIDKALKKYKKKFEKSRTLVQLRKRQAFTKPSVKRRFEVLKAIYVQQMTTGQLD